MVVPGRRSRPNMRVPAPTDNDQDADNNNHAVSEKPSDTTPAVPRETIIKLIAFSLAMIGAPLGTYFLSVNTIFRGNTTFAGASAAVVANVVLIAYIIVAWQEDQEDQAKRKEKKGQ
ncbi:hypothetical protein BGW36DRAFT_345941 [Talaromyces proteolyticus]|uniref:Vacuolar ATPase assembly integral membrane protein VMA21 n=1 Tax=Talaromyces proteolyticus TaxID=1131652 RepID=A0AAD4KL19_9EURO|nr:uncharacterized protein BGW36DRAFT_345941 [Talaromyces proteolyticus]KAH8694032.1 hypothetical protein BGW36DRAFT_345941 [Talaromyces proteolyticus]